MNTAATTCFQCGSPVFAEDRFCGTCGISRTPPPINAAATSGPSYHAAKLLARLTALTAGEYEIREEIGRGGMAAVYLAYDLRLNRKVAIKAMLPDLSFHEGMEERFKREARTAAKLDHPNIVVIYAVRDEGDPLFFVMKFVDGAPLDALIRAHAPLPVGVVQGLLVQLGNALQHAHDEGVVHRDVKPANILIDSRGNVQVTDFGIAKVVDSSQLTRTGLSIGTPAYMSPEQCLGHSGSTFSDQYAMGTLAYELLTGHAPFAGPAVEIQWAHVKEVPRPLRELRPDCPAELSDAIMRMLAKDPKDRWPTLRAVIPILASGIAPDADLGRPALSALAQRTAVQVRPFAPTPASPLPTRAAIRVTTPTVPVAVKPRDEPAATGAGDTPPVQSALEIASKVASLDVTPRQLRIDVGKTERVRCRVMNVHGHEVSQMPVWSSSDHAIASVDDTGLVTAHAVGAVTIAAMIDALAAMARVEVVAAPGVAAETTAPVKPKASAQVAAPAAAASAAVTVRIVPSDTTAAIGDTFVFGATVTDAQGRKLDDATVTWRSSAPAIARVDARGRVETRRAGVATIIAESDGIEAHSQLTVSQAAGKAWPMRLGIAAGVIAAAAAVVVFVRRDKTGATPDSAATAPLAIDSSAGSVGAPGAKAGGRPDSGVASAVIPGDTVVASLASTDPSPVSLEVGETAGLIMHAANRGGELVPNAKIEWRASDSTIATVAANGVVTATGVGRTSLVAQSGRRTKTIQVEVHRATPARIVIQPARDSLAVGQTMTLAAQAFDSRESPLEQAVTWHSSNPGVATVDERGAVTGVAAGRAALVASVSPAFDSVTINVVPASGTDAESLRVGSASVRSIGTPQRTTSRDVAPREVGASTSGLKAPTAAEARLVADSVVQMIERQTARITQLTSKAEGEPGVQFQRFIEQNSPTASLGTAPVVGEVRTTSATVIFGIVLDWEAGTARRNRTVNVECVMDAVRGGWAIREIRFPGGFTP